MNLRTMARVFGVVFLLVGVLGFVPGINQMHTTTEGEGLVVGGPGHGMLLGIFHVNLLHNLVHILFGVWGLVAGGSLGDGALAQVGAPALTTGIAVAAQSGIAAAVAATVTRWRRRA